MSEPEFDREELRAMVLVATGSVAAAWFPGKPPPVDALIIGSIDESAE